MISGHRDSWLENVSLENVKFFLSTDPSAAYDRSVHAMQFQYARNLKVKDVEIIWEKPASGKWQSALYFQDVSGLRVDGFAGGPGKPDAPAIVLNQVDDAEISNSKAQPGTRVFLGVVGKESQGIYLVGNELHDSLTPYQVDPEVKAGALKAVGNF
jgi:hypothetical protein